MIELSQVETHLVAQPEVAAWPAMLDVWRHFARNPRAWLLPELACQAVDGDMQAVVPVITAVACSHISIVLVDDILDDDPKGLYHQLGAGVAANLALAFQAVAYRVLAELETAVKPQLLAELITLNLQTARGQHMDVQPELSEAHYWATVAAKSTPYYGAGFYLGALAGGAAPHVAEDLRRFGLLIGQIIQVSDDLADVYQVPACPDWHRGGGNLAILYARLADHEGKARFEALLPQIEAGPVLEEAQQILLKSGAVSYCIYHLLQLAQQARGILAGCQVARPDLLAQFLAARVAHLFELLEANHMPLPAELAAELLG